MAAQGHGLALTLFGLDELMARYASYEDLATIIRHRFESPADTLHELFGRLVFNILCGNTDDHARNHAAFWDGRSFNLTPAYDFVRRAGRQRGHAGDARHRRPPIQPAFRLSGGRLRVSASADAAVGVVGIRSG